MSECNFEVIIPEKCQELDQNEEWVEFVTDNETCKVRLHEYGKFYDIPGLYDQFYKELKYQSPQVVTDALKTQIQNHNQHDHPLRVLDFGAGNGQVAELLTKKMDCEAVVGLDIISEARNAAERDRPGVYDEYYVMDMAESTDNSLEKLSNWHFNALVTVAALGFGDIGTKAFVNTYNLLDDNSWVAFNIKESFLSNSDETGFVQIINSMMEGGFELMESQRYCHRLSLAGEALYYYYIIGRKNSDITIS